MIQGDQLRHRYIPKESNSIYDVPGLVFLQNTSALESQSIFEKRHFTQTEALKRTAAKFESTAITEVQSSS